MEGFHGMNRPLATCFFPIHIFSTNKVLELVDSPQPNSKTSKDSLGCSFSLSQTVRVLLVSETNEHLWSLWDSCKIAHWPQLQALCLPIHKALYCFNNYFGIL